MVVLELPRRFAKETTADSKSKGNNTGYMRDLHGQKLSGKGCWSYLVTKLASLTLYEDIFTILSSLDTSKAIGIDSMGPINLRDLPL